ncbi:MAG: hypothetical protein ACJAWV_003209 [Flammeovirgaceae bacterium]|jgi:hypothetical protein
MLSQFLTKAFKIGEHDWQSGIRGEIWRFEISWLSSDKLWACKIQPKPFLLTDAQEFDFLVRFSSHPFNHRKGLKKTISEDVLLHNLVVASAMKRS